MAKRIIIVFIVCMNLVIQAQDVYKVDQTTSDAPQKQKIRLIIRMDDMGFCHTANMACKQVFENGVATAVSVMVISPWLDEAAAILREHPEISVGAHLTLNSEWNEYRWGPVLPYNQVSSLVDAYGKFYGSRRELMAHKPRVDEVAHELRAQIELALKKGLNLSYCDYHMGAAMNCLEFQEEVERLALEYNIGISRYFGEKEAGKIYSAAPEAKLEEGIKIIGGLTEPGTYLLVIHPGMDTPELSAMTDRNAFGLKDMSKHRAAEMEMLCHPDFKAAIQKRGIELIGYHDLKNEGLHLMRRPYIAEKYEDVVYKAIHPE